MRRSLASRDWDVYTLVSRCVFFVTVKWLKLDVNCTTSYRGFV